MLKNIQRYFRNQFRRKIIEIEPDEIFLDSSNLPNFDKSQFEGRIEQPIKRKAVFMLALIFFIIFAIATWKVWDLQILSGEAYASQSERNRLKHGLLFAERGVIYDRNQIELAWNEPNEEDQFASRKYIDQPGFSHILGYISYPKKDDYGVYYQEDYIGLDGAEKEFNDYISGRNGLKIIETDALNSIKSESVIKPPKNGENITLSIDSRVQEKMHSLISQTVRESQFEGGAGVVMDIYTGEILAMTSYPEFDSNILTEGENRDSISGFVNNKNKPFLNRIVSGLYAPGSIVKPFVAVGVLNEGIIDPEKEILSTGSISLPNPYDPEKFTIFHDWKPHGLVDMRKALAVSSNIYFFSVGGGFEDQKGLGIEKIEKYFRTFGLGEFTDINIADEELGTIPSPAWKAENFPGDDWRIGNTYHTVIGQYGFQVTPIQIVRATSAISRNGVLVRPTVLYGEKNNPEKINIPSEHFDVVKEGMRMAVTEGTISGLQFDNLEIAAKTGTAEVGVGQQFNNSWVIGFFPYDNPKYAFAFIMEHAPLGTLIGSVYVARGLFDWMIVNTPEYVF